ncbi:MAG: hydroxymethylbilane synthase, partial [Longispora sp.]|nr:hydroxymethylbilane synthase [Longispora sp. (in: high G+C Gram-positive bacteria)]
MVIRLGTRASALALAQSAMVAELITKVTGQQVKLVRITTPGDTQTASVQQLGVGVFASALRDALYAQEIDVAVHSYKDLPTAPAEGLTVVAVPPREDPRDALITGNGRKLSELPPGTRVGTGAPRRIAQLRALGLGLNIVPIRGNVDTRIDKVFSGELDAVVLAQAGLNRLGRGDEVTEVIDPLVMLPAPAQGALAIECRTGEALFDELRVLDD